MDSELKILLALYAEDVMRAVEREVKTVESLIRKKYPGAEYIELEPMSINAGKRTYGSGAEEYIPLHSLYMLTIYDLLRRPACYR